MAAPPSNPVVLLSRGDVAALLRFDACIAAVGQALALEARGLMAPAASLGMPVAGGGFHIKAATLPGASTYFAAKCNANFPANPQTSGLPTIQGVIVLADAADGRPLAIMDSAEITIQRTGAATALAARHLAREDARVVTICGCGVQGRIQLRAVLAARPIARVYAIDTDCAAAERFAAEARAAFGIDVIVGAEIGAAARASDICVTCTTSKTWFLRREHVQPGTFVAAVGADNPEKQEIEPALLARSALVVDSIAQCAEIGELHHAIETKIATRDHVRATLGEMVAGLRAGRTTQDDTVVFDSSGIAIEDVAAAVVVYEAALRENRGLRFAIAA
jgi:ornithine cyclodeaminase/alanine dehydrogenase-like protein (mu-crystallin family)